MQTLDHVHPDLILLDMILPDGTGLQVLQRVLEQAPAIPVLVMSGGARGLDLSPFAGVVRRVLEKPFGLEELESAIRAIEAGAEPPSAPPAQPSGMRLDVLLVDDDDLLRTELALHLDEQGYAVTQAQSPEDAVRLLGRRRYDVLVTDWIMPQMSGLDLLRQARQIRSDQAVIIMSGFGSVDFARTAFSCGAAEVLPKPFPPRLLPVAIEKALRQAQGIQPNGGQSSGQSQNPAVLSPLERIVGHSPAITRARQQLLRVAPLEATVLILGETGTGKELFAQALHAASARSSKPFVALNIAAVPESLMDAELFGYGTGAFTGAKREGYTGRLVMANGGTFFLDEIGDLPLPLQGKLLRVLQEREITPVGGASRRIDVRFVAATNKHLGRMVEQGTFRDDLLYRLNVVTITLPALRERPEDLPLLADHALAELSARYGGPRKRLADETLAVMSRYPWPGNVRELRNAVEHAFTFAAGEFLLPVHLPPHVCEYEPRAPQAEPPPERELTLTPALVRETPEQEAERTAIQAALAATRGNRVQAAKLLGMSRTSLYIRMKMYGLM